MHEAGFCHGVLHAVEDRAAGRPVARIGVRVGSLHRIVPAAFEQSFRMMAAGGVAEGASAQVTVVPAEGACGSCGGTFPSMDPPIACPRCGGFDVRASGGDELVLEWVEYREPVGG
jgi:hydrogenase nickel incorporation protein HypA/HybF